MQNSSALLLWITFEVTHFARILLVPIIFVSPSASFSLLTGGAWCVNNPWLAQAVYPLQFHVFHRQRNPFLHHCKTLFLTCLLSRFVRQTYKNSISPLNVVGWLRPTRSFCVDWIIAFSTKCSLCTSSTEELGLRASNFWKRGKNEDKRSSLNCLYAWRSIEAVPSAFQSRNISSIELSSSLVLENILRTILYGYIWWSKEDLIFYNYGCR